MNKQSYELFFKTLADPTRLDIINLLRQRPRSVGQISNNLDLEQSRVSHTLKTLTNYGFVDFKRKGKQRIYFLDKKTITPMLKLIDNFVEKYYTHLHECGCFKKCGCIGECKCINCKYCK